MPVPGPSALREAPSGEGGPDEGHQQSPRAGDREPREVGGTSSRTFLWPGCALSQVRDWAGLSATEWEGVGICWLAIPPLAHESGGADD